MSMTDVWLVFDQERLCFDQELAEVKTNESQETVRHTKSLLVLYENDPTSQVYGARRK